MFGASAVRKQLRRPLWPLELLGSRSNAPFAQKMDDGRTLFMALEEDSIVLLSEIPLDGFQIRSKIIVFPGIKGRLRF